MSTLRLAAACALLAAALAPSAAAAADGTDNCTGFIDAVPVEITSPGTWCLRANLVHAAPVAGAIVVLASDVTVDCNGFGIRNVVPLPNGVVGVRSDGTNALTVRNCRLSNFVAGVSITLGNGHVIEDNLVRDSRVYGISVVGSRSIVRRNRVLDTHDPVMSGVRGIEAGGEITDNVVVGVSTGAANDYSIGIYGSAYGADVRRNVVRGVGNVGIGVTIDGTILDNHVVGSGYGVGLLGNAGEACARNTVHGFATAIDCAHTVGNLEN